LPPTFPSPLRPTFNSHHIFSQTGIEAILNLQPKQGKAKAYQVKQIRSVILKYQLGEDPDAD
jgi:hypothetical protein